MVQCDKGLWKVDKNSNNITFFVQCIFAYFKHGHQTLLGAMIFSKTCFESFSLMKESICMYLILSKAFGTWDKILAGLWFYLSTILGKVFGTKLRNPVKLYRTRKVWYLLFRVFWLLLPKFNFWKGDWVLGYVSTQIWDFPNISLFPKILSVKSFGNSWDNSYTKFAILDITFRFTCG